MTSIVDLRRAIHRSSKVATSIFESDTSIFEDRRQKHHTYNSSPNTVHNCAPSPYRVDEVTHTHMCIYIYTCIKINNRDFKTANSNVMPTLRGFRWYPYFVAPELLVAFEASK